MKTIELCDNILDQTNKITEQANQIMNTCNNIIAEIRKSFLNDNDKIWFKRLLQENDLDWDEMLPTQKIDFLNSIENEKDREV